MANDFKRYAKADIGTGTGASGTTLYTVPAGAGSTALESIIIGISICNKTNAVKTVGIFLDNYDGSNDAYIINTISIPAYSQVEVMTGNKLVLQNDGSTGDILKAEASSVSSIDVVVSVLEDV
jgi:hypothetical protein|tara:strand:- start:1303 stop:1671 length:369 start_codon:yes stop_codon:yes gene_type:complete